MPHAIALANNLKDQIASPLVQETAQTLSNQQTIGFEGNSAVLSKVNQGGRGHPIAENTPGRWVKTRYFRLNFFILYRRVSLVILSRRAAWVWLPPVFSRARTTRFRSFSSSEIPSSGI